jgi:tellurite resistance protein TerC
MTGENFSAWVIFNAFVVAMLLLDAFVFNRSPREIKMKEVAFWCIFWVALALIFNVGVYFQLGKEKALQFLTGYLIEESLSIDNLFVFLLIFTYFKVPNIYQRKILFWGIIGAQVMRAGFIIGGVALIQKFAWIIYIFGAFLVYSGFRLFFEKEKETDLEKNLIVRWVSRILPVVPSFEGGKFFVKRNGKWIATLMLLVLIVIDVIDLIFAVDSIPAILAITKDPFIVYTSNIFAILGLRALYFALAGLMKLFHYLHYGLGAILIFVGAKMLLEEFIHIPIWLTLTFILSALSVSVLASKIFPEVHTAK